MKIVVDTNVIAYFILNTEPFVEEVRPLWRAITEAWAPVHWEAELVNAVWMAVRFRVLPEPEGYQRLEFASLLGIQSVPLRPLWQPALTRALASDVAVYDSLFVELAAQLRLPLATFDKSLLKKFPDIARRPGSLPSA